jgi:pSer/pThr/pTyr-binding forkhead associated (FHA) protein
VIQLHVLNGRKASVSFTSLRLPVTLGRGEPCDFRLEDDGVWDQHLEFSVAPPNQIQFRSTAEAFTAVNGQRVQEVILRNGDLIEIGGVQLRFGLAPVRQHSIAWREAFTWVALAVLALGQVVLIYLLNQSA